MSFATELATSSVTDERMYAHLTHLIYKDECMCIVKDLRMNMKLFFTTAIAYTDSNKILQQCCIFVFCLLLDGTDAGW